MNKYDPIGLALSGGGGKGAYQVGVWRALCELGWDQAVTCFSGASVGALNAAAIASAPDKIDGLWKNITPLDFLDIDAIPVTRDGIFSRSGLSSIILKNLDLLKLGSGMVKVYVNATLVDAAGGQIARYFDLTGKTPQEILTILLASSALPIAYPSETIGGQCYVDGGLTDNLPVKPLYDQGIRHIIGVNISEDPKPVYPELYPGLDYLEIRPSRDIGHLLDGTLDFSADGAALRMDIGYHDTLRTMKAYENGQLGNPDYDRIAQINADADNAKIDVDHLHDSLQSTADDTLGRLEALYKKYDI